MKRELLTVSEEYERVANCLTGNKQTKETWTPTYGDTSAWLSDVDWWLASEEDITGDSGLSFNGENGKSHNSNFEIGKGNGVYPGHEIKGFCFEHLQDSTAGHGLHLRRYGMVLQHESQGEIFWSSEVLSRRNDYNWKKRTVYLNHLKGIQEAFDEGYRFCTFRFMVSSEGGTGTRRTSLKVAKFRFLWNTLEGTEALILPMWRGHSNRFHNRIA